MFQDKAPVAHTATPIPLGLGAPSVAVGRGQKLAVTVSGVPDAAALTAGRNRGDRSWSLQPEELAHAAFIPGAGTIGTRTLSVTLTGIDVGTGDANVIATARVDIEARVGTATVTSKDEHAFAGDAMPAPAAAPAPEAPAAPTPDGSAQGMLAAWHQQATDEADGGAPLAPTLQTREAAVPGLPAMSALPVADDDAADEEQDAAIVASPATARPAPPVVQPSTETDTSRMLAAVARTPQAAMAAAMEGSVVTVRQARAASPPVRPGRKQEIVIVRSWPGRGRPGPTIRVGGAGANQPI